MQNIVYPFDQGDSSDNIRFEEEGSEDDSEVSYSGGTSSNKRNSWSGTPSKKEKVISAATLPKLLEKLTSLKLDNVDTHIENFVLVYPIYCTSQTLLELLLLRHAGPRPSDPTSLQETFQREKKNIRAGVFFVFKKWSERRSYDFRDGALMKQMDQWACNITDQQTREAHLFLFNTVKKMVSEKVTEYETKLSSKNVLAEKQKLDLRTVDPFEFAKALTLQEFHLMKRVPSHEFLRKSWSKNDRTEKAPHLTESINWFNRVSCWFSTEIVKETTVEGRAQIIGRIISIGMNCSELNNYNGVMEVLSCLSNSSISRLKLSWELLSSRSRDEYKQLNRTMSPKFNYKNYREILRSITPPFVPFLGIFLTDFTFMDDCKPDYASTRLLNFEKITSFGCKLRELYTFDKLDFTFPPIIPIEEPIMNATIYDDNDVYTISNLRESLEDQREAGGQAAATPRTAKPKNYTLGQASLVSTDHTELNERDWSYLLTGAILSIYKKDETILEEGVENHFLYRIKKGQIRIEKKQEGKPPLVVAQLGENSMFGEMSVLDKIGKTTARVVANADDTEIYSFDLEFIEKIFEAQPGVYKRFFNNLAIRLSNRLLQKNRDNIIRSQGGDGDALELTKPSTNLTKNLTRNKLDSSMRKKSIISPTSLANLSKESHEDLLIKEYDQVVAVNKRLTQVGRLLVQQKSIQFQYKVFGLDKFSVFRYDNITAIFIHNHSDDIITIETVKKKKMFRISPQTDMLDAFDLMEKIWTQQLHSASQSARFERKNSLLSLSKKFKEASLSSRPRTNTVSASPSLTSLVSLASFSKSNGDEKLIKHMNPLYRGGSENHHNNHRGPANPLYGTTSASLSSLAPSPLLSASASSASSFNEKGRKKGSKIVMSRDEESGLMYQSYTSKSATDIDQVRGGGGGEKKGNAAVDFGDIATNDSLTRRDWDTILKGAKSLCFKKEEKILEEGQSFQKIYQISKGSCRVEKMGDDGKNVVLGKMQPGETFGEVSFLIGKGAAVTVIADDDEVELTVIEGYFINILFDIRPGFAGRFFRYLCTVLVQRLIN